MADLTPDEYRALVAFSRGQDVAVIVEDGIRREVVMRAVLDLANMDRGRARNLVIEHERRKADSPEPVATPVRGPEPRRPVPVSPAPAPAPVAAAEPPAPVVVEPPAAPMPLPLGSYALWACGDCDYVGPDDDHGDDHLGGADLAPVTVTITRRELTP